jgi:hypothetical protein
VAERERRAADAHHVAVGQPPATDHPLASDERAVARQAVVDQQPMEPGALELGVEPGDLRIPRKADVAVGVTANPEDLHPVRERDDPLRRVLVAVEQEWHATPLGVESLPKLRRRRPVWPDR